MLNIKQIILRGLLVIEVLFFMGMYFFGSHGLRAVRLLKSENKQLEDAIVVLKNEVNALQTEISDWKSYPWHEEEIARSDLQLAYPEEEVFFIFDKDDNV